MKKYFKLLPLFLAIGLMMQSGNSNPPAAGYEDYVFIDLEE